MRSCTAAAAPCPAPARRTPGLMLTSPPAAAGRAPRGRETAGGPGDDPRGRFPAAERLQGQRSARRSRGEGRSPRRPAAVSEVDESSAPTSSPRRPRPRLPLRPATPPLRARGLVGVVVQCGPGGRRRPEGGAGGGGNWRVTAAETAPPLRSLSSTAANDAGPRGPSKQEAVLAGGKERPPFPLTAGRAPSPGSCSWKPGRGPSLCRRPLTPAPPRGYRIRPRSRQTRNKGSSTFSVWRFLWLIRFSVASHLSPAPR